MRKLTLLLLFLILLNIEAKNLFPKAKYTFIPNETIEILAIMKRESNFDRKALNLKENAVGVLQIRPIMIREVNNIQDSIKYKLSDRYSIKKSIEIYRIYQSKHNKFNHFETACRIWNGGQKGMSKSTTISYFKKVNDIYTSMRSNLVFTVNN